MHTAQFASRHLGIRSEDLDHMLVSIGAESLDQLIEETVPQGIRLGASMELSPALSEFEFLQHIQELAGENKLFKNYIGMGYHPTVTPSVIKRNVLENPGWYTAYTPYQAEIAQGRLEALLNYQTLVTELTGMELANASLLDESTAAAEAMTMLFELRSRDQKKSGCLKFFVADDVLPQTLALLRTRSAPLGIELVIGKAGEFSPDNSYYGALLQYPGSHGAIVDYAALVEAMHGIDAKVVVAADLLSLCLLTPPGEIGVDVVVGSTQKIWSTHGLWRAACRVFCYPGKLQASNPREDNRS